MTVRPGDTVRPARAKVTGVSDRVRFWPPTSRAQTMPLGQYLNERVFAGETLDILAPDAEDTAGFGAYLQRYEAGLARQQVAVDAMPATR